MGGRVKLITHNGETLRQHEWLTRTGLTRGQLDGRIRHGWSMAEALDTPPDQKYRPSSTMRAEPVDELTSDLLSELLRYDPDTGELFWKVRTSGRTDMTKRAGHLHDATGYWTIRIGGKGYLQHRIIWMMEHGEWPNPEIDHINRVRSDNRLVNLRVATRAEQVANCGTPMSAAWGNDK